jgi:hypothetical protein
MSPEQAAGELANVGPWSDQYSAGVVLFHLLTGQVPFRKGFPAILIEIGTALPPPPSSLRPDLGPEMDRIVLRALEKDPSLRFRDCREFADVLRDWCGRYTAAVIGGSRAPAPPPRTSGAGVSSKVWAAVVGALLTAILLGAGGFFLFRHRDTGPGLSPSAPATTPKGQRKNWEGE